MKIIRPVFAIVLLFAMLVSFTGCIIIPKYKNYDDIDTESVASVEIYDLRGDIHNSGGSYFLDSKEPVYKLTEEQQESFWDDLADINFTDYIIIVLAAVDPNFSYGEWVVRINYNDGSFMLISSDGYGESFDNEGNNISSNHYGCDDEEWEALIKDYLPQELFEAEPEPEQSTESDQNANESATAGL